MNKMFDRGMGKYAQSGFAWHFICILYVFKLSSGSKDRTLRLPSVREIYENPFADKVWQVSSIIVRTTKLINCQLNRHDFDFHFQEGNARQQVKI